MDARQVSETSTYLHQLADDVDPDTYGHWTLDEIADRLRELADRQLVALPVLNPRDVNLRHWTELSDHRLRSEIHADAWNLAAGIAVQRDRATIRQLGGAS